MTTTPGFARALAIGLEQYHLFKAYTPAKRKEVITDVFCEGRVLSAWCGEFASWVMMQAGARDPEAINRVAVAGKWRVGEDISIWTAFGRKRKILRPRVDGSGIYVMQAKGGGHIGFVESTNADGSFNTLDGNSFQPIGRNVRAAATPLHYFIHEEDLVALLSDTDVRIVGTQPPTPVSPPTPIPQPGCGIPWPNCNSGAGQDK